MKNFRQTTLIALIWNGISIAGSYGLRFIFGIFLARLLSPEEFGLLGMVTIFTGFAEIFTDFGFGSALIQKDKIRGEHFSSIFWLNIGLGFLIALILIALSPLIANFYSEPLLRPLTILVSFSLFISTFSNVQRAKLVRSLNFRKITIIDIGATIVAGSIALLLAYYGYGVWSLAVQSVMLAAFTAILLWHFSSWRPSFKIDRAAIRELLGFGSSVFGSQTLGYWVRHIDYLLIGRVLGTVALGIYNRAFLVMLFPTTTIARVLRRVLFASLSQIQNDKQRVKRIFLKTTRVVALLTFPLMLGLFVTVEPFVLTVFGEQWSEMIPVLRILALAGMIQSIDNLNVNLFQSQGKANLQFRLEIFLNTTFILAIVVGLRWGIVGVAVGYTIATVVTTVPFFYFAGKLVHISLLETVRNLAGIFSCAFVMATAVWVLGLYLPTTWPNWLHLMVLVCFGGLSYAVLIHIMRLQAYQDILELVTHYLPPLRIKLLSRKATS